jgi:hypothetical protein
MKSHPFVCEVSGAFEGRPAAVLLVTPCTVLTGLIKQLLPDILPNRMLTEKPDGVRLLDLNYPIASLAGHAQHMSGNLR